MNPPTDSPSVIDVHPETGEVMNVAALDSNGSALSPLLRPAATVDECEAAFADYQDLNRRLLDSSDFSTISGKQCMNRSGLRKLGVVYGVSFDIRDRNIVYGDDGKILRADFLIRAIAPNGRFADGWGAASSNEPIGRGEKADHNLPAVAETRAKNRASADLFAMGQVSADEIDRNVATIATREEKQGLLRQMEALSAEQTGKLQTWWAANIQEFGGIKRGDDPVGGSLQVDAIPEIEARIEALLLEQGEPF